MEFYIVLSVIIFYINKDRRSIMKSYVKLFSHIIAISLFCFGIVAIHHISNYFEPTLYFFNQEVHRIFVLDFGFVCIGISFFIEFTLSFRPIEVITHDA